MILKKQKRKQKLGNCPNGLFLFEDTLCVKTDYRRDDGTCICYIVSNGDCFWGGVTGYDAYMNLMVTPINIETNFSKKLEKCKEIINNLLINEVSKKGAISILDLIIKDLK